MKHYIDFWFDFANDPDSGNLHLWLPPDVLGEIDDALASMSLHTREDFGTLAILSALRQFRTDA